MNTSAREEITAAAIARLAGVGRSAVTNWRRRYTDFPPPVGGSATSPTFDRGAVEKWLRATGKADQLATFGRTDTGSELIAEPERSVSDLRPGEFLARVMAALLPRETADDESPADAPADADEEHAAEQHPDTGRASSVLEEVMWANLALWERRQLARANLPVVVDPACGDGTALLAVAARFGNRVRLAGQEIQPGLWDAARERLGDDAGYLVYEVNLGDSLLDDRLARYMGKAAAVVCEPPFDAPGWPEAELTGDPRWEFGLPAPRDGELAWVQHAYAHLRPGGVAVVAVSRRTCVAPSGEAIRTALIREGALRAVIELPAGMSTTGDTDVCLWFLRRPHGVPDTRPVQMIDLSGLGDPTDVPLEFAAWERLLGGSELITQRVTGLWEPPDPAVSRAVPRLDLIGGGVNLLPSRYVRRPAGADAASASELAATTKRLTRLYTRVGAGLPTFAAVPQPHRPAYVSIAELERSGALTIKPRDTTQREGDVVLRTLGRPPAVVSSMRDAEGRIFIAEVDGAAQVIEVEASRIDPYFVAMFLRADANALPVANTLGVVSRGDLRRCRIPRLPLAEQQRYGAEFRRLLELEAALRSLANLSGKVIEQAIHGLTAGTLVPSETIWNRMKTVGEGETGER